MKYNLSDVAFYAQEKVTVDTLTVGNYISTENMKPNRGGIVEAASLPKIVQTQKYKTGDILISNIRPYFKKIWFANMDGGCSNDVLVIRAKEKYDAKFLYYVLSDDAFFDYSTATAKGTKMPRGDKAAIMNYQVPVFSKDIQCKITSILSSIDRKIDLNKKINDNLYHKIA